MFGLGAAELIVIFLIIFLLFGAKALPEIAKALGNAIKLLKKETKEIKEGIDLDEGASQAPMRSSSDEQVQKPKESSQTNSEDTKQV
jgi:sec-independent protein translocase protein TatA